MMKKYTFRILPTIYNVSPLAIYDEVGHKIFNQNLEEVRIKIKANDVKEAFIKAKEELAQLLQYDFGDVKNLENYSVRLKLIEIQDG